MPLFYFHLFDDIACLDEEGQELPSAEEAVATARANAREMACAEVLRGRLNLNHRIEVADELGKVISIVTFRDAVEVTF